MSWRWSAGSSDRYASPASTTTVARTSPGRDQRRPSRGGPGPEPVTGCPRRSGRRPAPPRAPGPERAGPGGRPPPRRTPVPGRPHGCGSAARARPRQEPVAVPNPNRRYSRASPRAPAPRAARGPRSARRPCGTRVDAGLAQARPTSSPRRTSPAGPPRRVLAVEPGEPVIEMLRSGAAPRPLRPRPRTPRSRARRSRSDDGSRRRVPRRPEAVNPAPRIATSASTEPSSDGPGPGRRQRSRARRTRRRDRSPAGW